MASAAEHRAKAEAARAAIAVLEESASLHDWFAFLADQPAPEPVPVPPASARPLVGAYDHDNNTQGRIDAFARWAGYPQAEILRVHLLRGSLAEMRDNMFWLGDPTRGRELCVLFPLLADDMQPDQLLAGVYDDDLRTIGDRLVSNGNASARIALGHEHNLYPGFKWSTGLLGETTYQRCYRHVVGVLRSCLGQRFEFVWNLFFGGTAPIAYPGSEYVHTVTLDLYDLDDLERDPAARMNQFWWDGRNRDGRGLEWFLTLCRDLNKPYALDECGNERKTSAGGGDAPEYWELVREFVDAGDCRWLLVHNVENDEMDHRLTDYDTFADRDELAASAARFRELFGQK